MQVEQFRSLSDVELKKALEDAYREAFNLRFRLATRQLVNHREIRKTRKKIARLSTVIREKGL